ncbi:ribonuclease H [Senna tora]|uniref:Ribonuclease H n=1 Tax=Senna tora TaxID=362788 RepID=A0A834SDT5_9FABA|nr:ribonuclease H [Senna tora]
MGRLSFPGTLRQLFKASGPKKRPHTSKDQVFIPEKRRKILSMANNPREIGWNDSSDSDEGEDMEEMQENLAFHNIPPPEPRPASAPVVSLEPEFVQSNRTFWEKCLIGLLIDSRKFKVSRMQSIIDNFWYLRGPARVVGRVKRYYVIHFEVDEDRQHILNEGPWAMQGGLLSMFLWEPNLSLSTLLVTEVAVWVQLWHLPLEYQTPLMAEKIGALMGEVREINWAPTFPRNIRFLRVRIRIPTHTPLVMGVILRTDGGDHFWIQCKYERIFRLCRGCGRIGHLPQDCDRSREQVDMSLDAQRQWIQEQYGNAYGTMIDQAYFVPEARRFRFQPSRRTTYIRALYTRNGFQYRPRRADPMEFYFDPWVPMDAHGNMDPHIQEDQVELTTAQEILNANDPDSLDPDWQWLMERFCPISTPQEQPLPGIRLNEGRNPEDRNPAALNWIEFEQGEFGIATGWPMEGQIMPQFEDLNLFQHDPTEAEIEDMWKEIYANQQEENIPFGSTFEIGESSAARAAPEVPLEAGMVESMTGGTLSFLPPNRNLESTETRESVEIAQKVGIGNGVDGSNLEILEPQQQEGETGQSNDSNDSEHYLTITGENGVLEGQQLNQSTELVIMREGDEIPTHSEESGHDSGIVPVPVTREDMHLEGRPNKRKRPFELELIEQFVRKRGRIGPVNFTLTLKAPKAKKRKAIQLEELAETEEQKAKRLKVKHEEVTECPRPSTSGPEIAEVTELLESCFKGFGEVVPQQPPKLGLFDYSFCIDPVGSKGGLGIWWNKHIQVTVLQSSHNWIHLKITNVTNHQFYFTGVYGAPVRSEREKVWQFLRDLNIQNDPWLLTGDFNQVASMDEKLSHCQNIPGSENLNETINKLCLVDLQTSGNWFTWTNGRQGEALVWERLDKSFVNTTWIHHFPDFWVDVLPVLTSDHSPLIINSHKSTHKPYKKPFHFEAMWLQHPQLKAVMESAWQKLVTGSMSSQVQDRIKNVSKDLSIWHKTNFGDLSNQIKDAHMQVENFQQNIQHHSRNNEELVARKRLEFLLNCEEIKWAQRAKHLWLLKGDRNTKFFHTMVNHQRNKSRINSIQLQTGQWIDDQEGIKQAATEYFQQLYTNRNEGDEDTRRHFISQSGTPKLNQGHIQLLSKPFSKMEIETALFQMQGGKAPGPDGMSPMFFQHCWNTVHEGVTNMVSSFVSRGHILRTMNQTHIALIPKVEYPSSFKDYRPISLCNTTYKIISKVLTNRLQAVMADIISPNQNAFVKGRLIQDNILIASETLHYIRGCKRTKGGWVTLKVDLQKAYDKISWSFLHDVLEYMNFPPLWKQLLMQCVTTTSMRVKVNGELSDWILPSAGLRQGDPLSPYLYVLCANVLSNHLISAQNNKSIQGIKIARGAPNINHLMYADDILLFFKANRSTCTQVANLLTQFGDVAVLYMNNQKTEAKFSPNITEEGARVLTGILNCRKVDHLGKYLGSYIDGANTAKRNASLILDNLQQRLSGWKSKMLSQAARTTLIKAVVSAVPIFHLQHTWLSHSAAAKCDRVMRKFFWNHWDEAKSPAMISWKRLCRSRRVGGMGFQQMLHLNEALLAKQVWRILTLEDTLVSKVFRGKYTISLRNDCITAKPNSSPLWKQLCKASRVVTANLGWRVGNGDKTSLNEPKWIPQDFNNHQFNRLRDLMLPGGFWDSAKVAQVYSYSKKNFILDTAISHTNVEDKLIWTQTANGEFKVNKAYEILSRNTLSNNATGFQWDRLWKIPLPQRILHFWWKNLNKGLPLKMNLARKGFQISTECPYGCNVTETEEHLLKDCQFAKRVWFESRLNLRTEGISSTSMTDWVSQQITTFSSTSFPQHKEMVMLLLSICWSLYTQRNQILFQQGKDDVTECLSRAYRIVDDVTGMERIQQQEPFFRTDIPKKQQHSNNRTRAEGTNGIILICNWMKDYRTRRKVFSIFKQTRTHRMLICTMVTASDQDVRLAMLRSIHLFLEDYGSHQMGPITFNIPCKQLLSQLQNKVALSNDSQVVFTLAGQLGGIL